MSETPFSNQNQDPQDIPTLIETRVEEAMRAIVLLIDHGEDAVVQQGHAERSILFGLGVDRDMGVELYSSNSDSIGAPVLARIYGQMGAVNARIAAVPIVSELELSEEARVQHPPSLVKTLAYIFSIPGDIKFTEEQSVFPDGSKLYQLFGQKVDTAASSASPSV